MKKVIIIVTATLMALAIIQVSGASVMSALFPADEILDAQYWEALREFLYALVMAAVVAVVLIAYRWVPTLWFCVRAQFAQSPAEERYFERRARDWNRRS